jgi:hypothetical protein
MVLNLYKKINFCFYILKICYNKDQTFSIFKLLRGVFLKSKGNRQIIFSVSNHFQEEKY